MEWIANPEIWIGLVTLTCLEIVLGIDNIVFISIIASKLPEGQQDRARRVGLLLAMGTRILLLLSISWIVGLTGTLFTVRGNEISWRDLILLAGGLFLIYKSTHEIHDKVEGTGEDPTRIGKVVTFRKVLIQIMIIDVVFSLDSVITAVGMVNEVGVMIAAVVIAVMVMMIAAGPISRFVEAHPTVKMLALSFLLMIGVALVADGLGFEIPKGYIYFAMGFSMMVEFFNLRAAKNTTPTEA